MTTATVAATPSGDSPALVSGGGLLPRPIARWSFDEASGAAVAQDAISGKADTIAGLFRRVPGVVGTGLRFDGYTTAVVRSVAAPPISDTRPAPVNPGLALTRAFTLSAWVALDAYPWNWVPVIDQDRDQQAGFSFGIDAFGHVGLRMALNGGWQAITSARRLPLKRWVQIVATFDGEKGMAVYIDGEAAGELAMPGKFLAAEKTDLLIGRVRQPTLPYPSQAIHPLDPVWYSIDGILDEVEVRSSALSAAQIGRWRQSVHPDPGDVLPWAQLPAGPSGPGAFGAYSCSLDYEPEWDRLRRIGPGADVVVRFDRSAMRLVFWQGTAYEPAWVTENGKWYTDEFLEAYGPPGCTGGEDCEPMSDKQTRYAHVSILESNDARAVVHWRYALAETRNYSGSFTDPLTGWSDWADEYWTVYPDGVAVRKQVLWTSEQADWAHEWQETIVINAPGQRPEDNLEYAALTLANLKGESATYRWSPKLSDEFDYPQGPGSLPQPANANIQVVNLKSALKPFQIVAPEGARILPYNGEKSYSAFEWWNHWPVAQIASSGRPALAADRASHTSLSHIYWGVYQRTDRSVTKLLLSGLTGKAAADLAPLARSWLTPPVMRVDGAAGSAGYDPAQRAFIVTGLNGRGPGPCTVTWEANRQAPLVNPALVIRGWSGAAHFHLDGHALAESGRLRVGHERHLEGTDLVVWLELDSTQPTKLEIAP